MTELGFSIDRDIEAEEARIAAYLESELGCSDVSIHRMRRWRPIMRADVTRNGVRQRMFLKGERTWPTHPYPLEYERDMQVALSRNGVVVPEILGWVEDPKTIVMAWVGLPWATAMAVSFSTARSSSRCASAMARSASRSRSIFSMASAASSPIDLG